MCTFISVAVAGFAGDAAKPFVSRRLFTGPISISGAGTEMLPDGAAKFSVGDGHCACCIYNHSTGKALDLDDARRRYERKGWSKAKIDRAIEARRVAHERPSPVSENAKAFVAAIEELVNGRARVTLFATDDDSSSLVTGSQRIALGDFVASGGSFPQSTIVSIEA